MAKLTITLVALILFAASLITVFGNTKAPYQSAYQSTPLTTCQVKVVYDGDTFGCDLDKNGKINGQEEHIRMIGIDSAEMHYSRKNQSGQDQPFAKEATQFVEQAILNRSVYLEFDQERFDTYNRTLAYVYLDAKRKQMLNQALLEKGLAKVFFIRVNRRYEPEFVQTEGLAQAKRLNFWATQAP